MFGETQKEHKLTRKQISKKNFWSTLRENLACYRITFIYFLLNWKGWSEVAFCRLVARRKRVASPLPTADTFDVVYGIQVYKLGLQKFHQTFVQHRRLIQ